MKTIAAILVLSLLTACGSDFASPFDKPEQTVQPVDCAASTSCG